MPRLLYTLVFYVLLPIILLRLLWRGIKAPAYLRRWSERFGFAGSPEVSPSLWLHAVSVGEVLAARMLVEALLEDYPQYKLVLTTTTPTGSQQVQRLFGARVRHSYAPYDLPDCLARFLKRIRPALLIIMETEVWPNTIAACASRHIPVILANGRLSEKSQQGYMRLSSLFQPVFSQLTQVVAQSSVEVERFRTLGAEHIQVSGNIKLDVCLEPPIVTRARQLKEQWRGAQARNILVAASTHRGEEVLIVAAFEQLQAKFPSLLLVLVPRHPERFNEVKQLCLKRGLRCVDRSGGAWVDSKTSVLIVDTMGELPTLLGTADIAIMGGTFIEHGGHNFLEPALWAIPIVSGKSCYNFAEIATGLLDVGALHQLDKVDALVSTLTTLLADDSLRDRQGQAALRYVKANRGALQRLLAALAPYL
ncbi:MAG: lipid IV(A) 3-deoxy-D-manno-octulosonic acid transferase [Cellvibrionaceae bacterium]|nr:lipid IV(A) 3-deoxy-D-manno-octulosonic acid transferase [Cellvibrionaceae bacterium]